MNDDEDDNDDDDDGNMNLADDDDDGNTNLAMKLNTPPEDLHEDAADKKALHFSKQNLRWIT